MNGETWSKLIAPIRRRIQLMISRAVGRMVDPSVMLQTVQVELMKGELLDGVEHTEGYGRTANPPSGWEGVAASVGGDRSHAVLLSAFHRQYRVRNLAEGEQALYDDLGNVIHLKRDRILLNGVDMTEIIAPICHIVATTTHDGDVTINGNLVVSGNADIGGSAVIDGAAAVGGAVYSATSIADPTGTMANMRITYNGHTHNDPQGGVTSNPNQQM